MLTLRQDQVDELTRSFFFRKLHKFLGERRRHERILAQLSDPRKCSILWRRFWEGVKSSSEKKAAITLTFVLACRYEDLSPEEMFTQALQQSIPEFFISCWMRADAIARSGMLRRFNRYREALPFAYAAEDMNTLGDAADDEDRQEKRQKEKCLTRLPDSAPKLNIALGLPEGTIQDKDLRNDDIGFRAGLYRNEADGKLILAPRDTQPNSFVDWQTNTDNGQSLDTRQCNAMRDLAKTLYKKGVRFDLAGYSKGGGQAQFAGLFSTNSQVRIFNSAGLPDHTFEGTGLDSFQPRQPGPGLLMRKVIS